MCCLMTTAARHILQSLQVSLIMHPACVAMCYADIYMLLICCLSWWRWKSESLTWQVESLHWDTVCAEASPFLSSNLSLLTEVAVEWDAQGGNPDVDILCCISLLLTKTKHCQRSPRGVTWHFTQVNVCSRLSRWLKVLCSHSQYFSERLEVCVHDASFSPPGNPSVIQWELTHSPPAVVSLSQTLNSNKIKLHADSRWWIPDKQMAVALHTEPLLLAINTLWPPTVEPRLRQHAPRGKLALYPIQAVEQHRPTSCIARFVLKRLPGSVVPSPHLLNKMTPSVNWPPPFLHAAVTYWSCHRVRFGWPKCDYQRPPTVGQRICVHACVWLCARECWEITFSVSAVWASFLSRQIALLRELGICCAVAKIAVAPLSPSSFHSFSLSHPTCVFFVILVPNMSWMMHPYDTGSLSGVSLLLVFWSALPHNPDESDEGNHNKLWFLQKKESLNRGKRVEGKWSRATG